MSWSMTKGEGLTILAVTYDPESTFPWLCQLLRTLCCPCFMSSRLQKPMVGPLSSLATVQIMMGLFTIGLGAVELSLYDPDYFIMGIVGAPYWLGGTFIVSGIFTIIGKRFPRPFWVFLTGTINLVSAVLAIVGMGFYLADDGMSLASDPYDRYDYDYGGYRPGRVNLTDVEQRMKELCQMYKSAVQPVAIGLPVLLLATAALQLCVAISVAVLAMMAFNKNCKEEVPEVKQPLMEEVTANPVA